jgi:hypothetical protein
VDEDRQRLERAFKASPDDEAAARAYHTALLRAGERAAVRESYAFKFRCPLTWAQLAPTGDDMKKHCKECDRDVHFVNTTPKLREHVAAGRCVAIIESRELSFVDGLVDEPRVHGAQDPDAPCIVVVESKKVPERPTPTGRVLMGAVAPRPRPTPPGRG